MKKKKALSSYNISFISTNNLQRAHSITMSFVTQNPKHVSTAFSGWMTKSKLRFFCSTSLFVATIHVETFFRRHFQMTGRFQRFQNSYIVFLPVRPLSKHSFLCIKYSIILRPLGKEFPRAKHLQLSDLVFVLVRGKCKNLGLCCGLSLTHQASIVASKNNVNLRPVNLSCKFCHVTLPYIVSNAIST